MNCGRPDIPSRKAGKSCKFRHHEYARSISMLRRASNAKARRSRFNAALRGAAANALCAGVACLAFATRTPAQDAKVKIPELASIDFAWLAFGVHWFDPPPGL